MQATEDQYLSVQSRADVRLSAARSTRIDQKQQTVTRHTQTMHDCVRKCAVRVPVIDWIKWPATTQATANNSHAMTFFSVVAAAADGVKNFKIAYDLTD